MKTLRDKLLEIDKLRQTHQIDNPEFIDQILQAIQERLPKPEFIAMDTNSVEEGLAEIKGANMMLIEVYKALGIPDGE